MNERPPCVLFEDEHLLVVQKPAGLNTHAPSPYASEGIYEWLKHREPRWGSLAIIHRLDKETSGVLVFSKSTLGNRALTRQFTDRSLQKRYILLTDRAVPSRQLIARSNLSRVGAKCVSRPGGGGPIAETRFRRLGVGEHGRTQVEAEPLTGRTHQIRVHAADHGFPVIGDTLYGGSPFRRVCLHAASITLAHPATGQLMTFEAVPKFDLDPSEDLRRAIISPEFTNAYRLIHGAADHQPGIYIDRLGDFLISTSEEREPPVELRNKVIAPAMERYGLRGIYHKQLRTQPGAVGAEASPRHVAGEVAPEPFIVRENGLEFGLSFREGYSIGLFLDQRDNRRRLLSGHVAADFPLYPDGPEGKEVLNTFAYTCAFSVCAAAGGARATSLDLSKGYLDWGRRNFRLNALDPDAHDFIYGDAFDWLRRLARKQRQFDVIILDPPTFSRSKQHGTFRVEKDYPALVKAALPLIKSGGVMLASTNAAAFKPEAFTEMLEATVNGTHFEIVQQHYFPQPPDFPITREEPGYLKTVWLRVRQRSGGSFK